MNIFIITDLEGISCVDSIDMIFGKEPHQYPLACKRLMADVNAAVDGLFEGGASRVFVIDGHGGGDNFLPGQLHPKAEFISSMRGSEEIFKKCNALAFVGVHAMAGTRNAFLDHTMNSAKWYNYYINRRPAGEMAMGGLYAGFFGVPVIFASGDEAACREAEEFFPGITTASVKTSKIRNSAVCLEAGNAEALIREKCRESLININKIPPFTVPFPFNIKLELNRSDYCDAIIAAHPDFSRPDARIVQNIVDGPCSYYSLAFLE